MWRRRAFGRCRRSPGVLGTVDVHQFGENARRRVGEVLDEDKLQLPEGRRCSGDERRDPDKAQYAVDGLDAARHAADRRRLAELAQVYLQDGSVRRSSAAESIFSRQHVTRFHYNDEFLYCNYPVLA